MSARSVSAAEIFAFRGVDERSLSTTDGPCIGNIIGMRRATKGACLGLATVIEVACGARSEIGDLYGGPQSIQGLQGEPPLAEDAALIADAVATPDASRSPSSSPSTGSPSPSPSPSDSSQPPDTTTLRIDASMGCTVDEVAEWLNGVGAYCSSKFSETCGGTVYTATCDSSTGTCVCFGSGKVVNFTIGPYCPGKARPGAAADQIFALCGFPH